MPAGIVLNHKAIDSPQKNENKKIDKIDKECFDELYGSV